MALLPPPPPPAVLPCPLTAGWEVVDSTRLPRRGTDGEAIGGFSAAVYSAAEDGFWLLSDAPRGRLQLWRGLRRGLGSPPVLAATFPLAGTPEAPLPAAMDGEGLVLRGEDAWVVSEGRRTADRPAQLLRFDRRSGRLRQALPLPEAWNPAPGRGLAANQGPESLALVEGAGGPPRLLLAAESALLQDPPGEVRVLAWPLAGGTVGRPVPLRSLRLPVGEGWGLTDLVAVGPGLLGLQRRFEPPDHWQARLVLYPLPGPARAGEPPLAPLAGWDLLAHGLPPDNWEALAIGPALSDGRPTLVLASDDNFSPFQDNHLVRLAPLRGPGCPPPPAR